MYQKILNYFLQKQQIFLPTEENGDVCLNFCQALYLKFLFVNYY